MSENPIRILLVEDNPPDARLIREMLVEAGMARFRIVHADRLAKALAALTEERLDVVLLDLSLPDAHGLETLKRVRTAAPGLPIVVLTHHQDEHLALQAVRMGAQDYLIKGDGRSAPLVRSIRHVIERKQAEEQYRILFESNPYPMWVLDPAAFVFISVNEAAVRFYGYTREETLAGTVRDLCASGEIPPLLKGGAKKGKDEAEPGSAKLSEWTLRKKDGTITTAEVTCRRIDFKGKEALLILANDITQRKKAEEALRESEARFHLIARATNDAVWDWDLASDALWWNERFKTMFGYKNEEIEPGIGSWSSRIHSEDKERVLLSIHAAIDRGEHAWSDEYRFRRSDGSYAAIFDRGHVVRDEGGRPIRMVGAMMDITERKRDEEALKENHQLLRAVIEGTPDAVYVKDRQGRYLMVNSAVARLFGTSFKEIIGRSDTHLLSNGTAGKITEEDRRVMSTGESRTFEEVVTTDERTRTFLSTKGPWRNHQGEIIGLVGISRDITERKEAEISLRAHDRQQAALAELGQQALAGLDFYTLLDKTAVRVADALETEYCKILELLPDGKTLLLRAGFGWKEGLIRIATLAANAESQGGYTLLEKGPVVVEDLRTETRFTAPSLLREHGAVSGISVVIPGASRPFGTLAVHSKDRRSFAQEEIRFLQVVANMLATAIARRRAEEMIQHQAYYDALTGLPNRSLMENHLSLALARADRHDDMVALMFLDLDCFKEINDTLGHLAGDQLLKAVSERLSTCVREGDTFARIGGDEFTVLLPEIDSIEKVTRVAERILGAFTPPFRLTRHELRVSASIGIALYPKSGHDAETLLRNADTALYRAKKQGRNTFCFFSPEMSQEAIGRMSLEGSLRKALEREEFFLDYQPQIDLKTGQIIGLETLIRWRRPDGKLIPPVEFIPLAEETGLIAAIWEWVLHAACVQMRDWQASGLPPVRIAMNLSPGQFHREDLVGTVSRALAHTGLSPNCLEFELTEKMLMRKEEATLGLLRKLAAMGLTLTIDDFGSGYSSLSYLKRLPISKLKIDHSFIRNITTDPNDAAIAETVVAMARSLHLKAVAEGVETEAQRAFLNAIECDEAQGYFFSRPVPPQEVERLLVSGIRL